jgi:hypothetical protein
MDLIVLILGIALIGFLAWVVTTYIPMGPPFKLAIYIICAVVLVLFLLRQFGGVVPNVMP